MDVNLMSFVYRGAGVAGKAVSNTHSQPPELNIWGHFPFCDNSAWKKGLLLYPRSLRIIHACVLVEEAGSVL